MKFLSTREGAAPVSLSCALSAGLAPDGGLYVPERLPQLAPAEWPAPDAPLAAVAEAMLRPYFVDDPLEKQLSAICKEALDVPIALRPLPGAQAQLLELFHGPTAAFKDFAARFLASCLAHIQRDAAGTRTVLVATSGDTGAAVASAFFGRAGFEVCVLYPDGRVSPRQAHQLGALGGNVHALRVAGSFDDCQRMVKQLLADAACAAEFGLTSANSISLGRLLPQMSYYAWAARRLVAQGAPPVHFVVPTGNLGNALAALWAQAMGAPIAQISLACNANAALAEFVAGAPYAPRASVQTLANAMDVGAPSNFERLLWTFGDEASCRAKLRAHVAQDEEIVRMISMAWQREKMAICPHTACGYALLQEASIAAHSMVLVATAHPAKFEQIVEPIVGCAIEPPAALAQLLARPAHAEPLAAQAEALRAHLRASRKRAT